MESSHFNLNNTTMKTQTTLSVLGLCFFIVIGLGCYDFGPFVSLKSEVRLNDDGSALIIKNNDDFDYEGGHLLFIAERKNERYHVYDYHLASLAQDTLALENFRSDEGEELSEDFDPSMFCIFVDLADESGTGEFEYYFE